MEVSGPIRAALKAARLARILASTLLSAGVCVIGV